MKYNFIKINSNNINMGGGILQLLAMGPQNQFISGNPEITFFKKVYKRHTNFSVEQMEQVFIGDKSFGKKVKCKIERKGDLLKDIYLMIKINDGNDSNYYDYQKNILKSGFSIIEYVEIEIGGQVIDKHYGEWMDIWTQLTFTPYKYEMLMSLIKDRRHKMMYDNYKNSVNYDGSVETNYIYVPLFFWFNREPGLALPLISIQFHEVNLNLKFKSLNNIKIIDETTETLYNDLYNYIPKDNITENSFLNPNTDDDFSIRNWKLDTFTGSIEDVVCYCDFIFLDVDERKLFANKNHEYLIEQVQIVEKLGMPPLTTSNPNKNIEFSLEFNHPIKEIIWTVTNKNLEGTLFYKNLDFSNIVSDIVMQANNIDFIKKREPEYFNLVQPYQFHNGGGLIQFNKNRYYNGGYYIYSFAIDPEKYQPSGTLNFSKLNNFSINFNYQKTSSDFTTIDEEYKFTCYAINYNILKIANGMAGLAYTN